MTFIELMNMIVERGSFNEREMRDAKVLLAELEKLNAFGVVLGTTAAQGHDCVRSNEPGRYNQCRVCNKDLGAYFS